LYCIHDVVLDEGWMECVVQEDTINCLDNVTSMPDCKRSLCDLQQELSESGSVAVL